MSEQQMRLGNVPAKLRAGEVVSRFKINLADARAVEIVAMAGFAHGFRTLWHGDV